MSLTLLSGESTSDNVYVHSKFSTKVAIAMQNRLSRRLVERASELGVKLRRTVFSDIRRMNAWTSQATYNTLGNSQYIAGITIREFPEPYHNHGIVLEI